MEGGGADRFRGRLRQVVRWEDRRQQHGVDDPEGIARDQRGMLWALAQVDGRDVVEVDEGKPPVREKGAMRQVVVAIGGRSACPPQTAAACT